jgi:hypothetical protein
VPSETGPWTDLEIQPSQPSALPSQIHTLHLELLPERHTQPLSMDTRDPHYARCDSRIRPTHIAFRSSALTSEGGAEGGCELDRDSLDAEKEPPVDSDKLGTSKVALVDGDTVCESARLCSFLESESVGECKQREREEG